MNLAKLASKQATGSVKLRFHSYSQRSLASPYRPEAISYIYKSFFNTKNNYSTTDTSNEIPQDKIIETSQILNPKKSINESSKFQATEGSSVPKKGKPKRENLVFNNRTGPSLQHFLSNSINIDSLKNSANIKTPLENLPYLGKSNDFDPKSTKDFDWGEGRTYYVEVYGCQMNVNDTEILMSILESSGYKRSLDSSSADVLFLMTCSIREKAENKIWGRLREIRAFNQKTRKSNPQKVGVLGCMAERLKDKLLEQDKLVDVVCGPDAYRSLPRLLSLRSLTNQGVANVILSADETYADISPVRIDPNQISVHLSVMRGCNNMCSFCVVPFTRGTERSRPIDSIVKEAKNLSDSGIREITLLGQNVNSYRDLSSSDTKIEGYGDELSRGFSTIYKKKEGGRRFAELLNQVSLVDPESGSTTVLERMRRGYSFESYIALVDKIREILPNVTLSTDLIVGFCGETDYEFNQTLELVKRVEFDTAYMFAYSLREKTHAHRKYKDDVPAEIKQARLAQLIDLFHETAKKKNQKYIGTHVLVLVDTSNQNDPAKVARNSTQQLSDPLKGLLSGFDEFSHKVFLYPSEHNSQEFFKVNKGDYVLAKVVSASSVSLTAQVISKSSVKEYFS
ncbi:CDK5 regulatory subunit-associated protein 1 [Smittium culicis]|uniref:CDK5 regulatory subunit-associated protein 1 n=1 Tax=Smittium culicis TaxID=133412 RepID=A0A1R1XQ19_9FUNG|nr:CDK5 regulatory subunit-associated protein 1 [Smittium culicis]OMJ25176.1 CDK5 regulatory subunit-associated protein 1 [Smittium culicis]